MSQKNKKVIRYLAATALSFGIVGLYALIALNLSIFNPVKQVMRDYSITDFYYQVLDMSTDKDTSRIITIVDMTELRDRRDIAYALNEVLEQQPKVVGVDIMFEGLKADNPEGDSLMAAVAATDTSAVFAMQYYDDSFDGSQYTRLKQSFFADSMPQLKEALVNMPLDKYGGMKRQISIAKKVKGGMCPSMVKRLSDEYAGEEIMPLADKTMKINWSPVAFRVVPYDSVSYYGEYLADRIVLFGACGDEADMHLTPQGKMAGVKLMAYGIETMVKQREVRSAPWWVTAILSFIIVLLTKLFFDHYGQYADSRKNGFLRIALKTSLLKGILKFIWMAILMYIGFILFVKCSISINFAWALSAVAFTGSAEDLYTVVSNSLSKK